MSGGTDEVVKVWDLRRRKEVGTLEGDTSGECSPSVIAEGTLQLTLERNR